MKVYTKLYFESYSFLLVYTCFVSLLFSYTLSILILEIGELLGIFTKY